MSYEKLSLDGFIDEMKEATIGPYARKFCFILGAGASKEAGIKTGQELVRIWDDMLSIRNNEEHSKWKAELGITEENKSRFYSQFYERRYDHNTGDGENFLFKLIEKAMPSAGHIILAYILTKTPHNVAVTTNFDRLIEEAVTYYMHDIPMVIGHRTLAWRIDRKHLKQPTIVKIHHDLLFRPISQPTALDKLPEELEAALDIIFAEYCPVFIGYAGNDKDLMDYLKKNLKKFSTREFNCPYWFLYKNDVLYDEILNFLNESNGFYIEHSGFGKVLSLMGTAFGYEMPSEEEFLEDAKMRFKKLAGEIDSLSEKTSKAEESAADVQTDADSAEEKSKINQAMEQITSKNERQRMYWDALHLHRAGNYEEALKIKQELVSLEPNNARYHDSLGVTLHEMKRYEEALAEKQKAVELEPDNAQYHDSLGTTLHEMGRYEEALAESRKAVELEPDNAWYHDSLGTTLREMKRYEEALAEKQKAVELEPDIARYHNNLGVTLLKMKRYEEALAESQKALKLEPDNARYHNETGCNLRALKRYGEAVAEHQRAIDLDPDNAWWHGSLSITLHEMKRYEEALVEKQKAVTLDPDIARYHNSLGVTLHEMKRYEEALAEKQKAVELEPDIARYHNSLGVTLHEMERYEEALAEKQKAVELEPDNAEYIRSLNATKRKLGL